ncbi:MAG: hypothetical protein KBT19_05185 [Lachnospiraceae bacterium]|nr:hypothetical protein [Candidatus Colinaster equi]
MNMQFGKKERDLLIGVAGIIVAVLVWFLVASPYKDKTQVLKDENATLKPQAELYEAVNARLDEYQDGIVDFQNKSNEILAHFPVNIERQDELMFWTMGDAVAPTEYAFGDIAMEESDPVAVIGGTVEEDVEITTDEEGNQTIKDEDLDKVHAEYTLMGAPVAMEFASTYTGLKSMINYIQSQNDKNAIKELEVEFDDSTGLLSGGVAVYLYYIPDSGKDYVPSYIPNVPTGVSDIFHTIGTDINVPREQVEELEDTENAEESENNE